jgi:hypothetical protein
VLKGVAQQLDRWIAEQNRLCRQEGAALLKPCTIKVLGQAALLEANLGIALAVTNDVDVRADYEWSIERTFEQLLAEAGRALDPSGHEAWMPRETRYNDHFRGHFVHLLLAEPEAILLSKALKAPDKNRVLITEYLARGASERFLDLAEKYGLDLEQFL